MRWHQVHVSGPWPRKLDVLRLSEAVRLRRRDGALREVCQVGAGRSRAAEDRSAAMNLATVAETP